MMRRALLSLVLLLLMAVSPLPGRAAGEFDKINANVPLRTYILATLKYPNSSAEINASVCDELFQLAKAKGAMEFSEAELDNAKTSGHIANTFSLQDITSLDGIEVLEKIDINRLVLSDMRHLFADDKQTATWQSLRKLSGVARWDLSHNGIRQIPTGMLPSSVEELSLADNQVSDFTFLSGLPVIEGLDVSNNPVANSAPIKAAGTITTLHFNNNACDLSFLSSMTQLKTLSISGTGLTDANWSVLAPLANLTELDVSENLLTSPNPLSALVDQGKFAKLNYVNMSRNFVRAWLSNAPAGVKHITLLDNPNEQYQLAMLQNNNVLSRLDVSHTQTYQLAKKLGNKTSPIHAVLAASTSFTFDVTCNGSEVKLVPMRNGLDTLTVHALQNAADGEAGKLEIPVNITGGTLSATLQLRANGRSVYERVGGLFAGAYADVVLPSRERCTALFRLVGIDMDEYEIPTQQAIRLQAGQTKLVDMQRIANGTVQINHRMKNGFIMSREELKNVQGGYYTFQPRTDIRGYVAESKALRKRIDYQNRNLVIDFYYQYSKAADDNASAQPVQNGTYHSLDAVNGGTAAASSQTNLYVMQSVIPYSGTPQKID